MIFLGICFIVNVIQFNEEDGIDFITCLHNYVKNAFIFMNTTIKKYMLNEIDEAIKETLNLLSELTDKETTVLRIEKTYELQAIMNDLKKIQSQILTNSLPPKKHRFVSYEIFIIENWGIRHTLGKKLLDIATKYTNSL